MLLLLLLRGLGSWFLSPVAATPIPIIVIADDGVPAPDKRGEREGEVGKLTGQFDRVN